MTDSPVPPRWHRSLSSLLLLAALGCPAASEGDDLPPGAFTTGGDELPPADTTEASTTTAPPEDDSTTATPPVDTGSSEGPPPVLSHELDIKPLWDAGCIDASCHDADMPQAGLDLASDGVLERLCEGDHNFSGLRYIDCETHDPARSYAFRKIEGTHLDGDISGASGLTMPPTEPLPQDQIDTIEAWIAGGTLP